MSLKTAGIREFARMIGRSHSWVVSQCQRNIIPKTTDGKIPVDEALKAVARLFAAVRARTRTRGNPQIIVFPRKSLSCSHGVRMEFKEALQNPHL